MFQQRLSYTVSRLFQFFPVMFVIGYETFAEPVCLSLAVVAENETFLVEAILYVAEFDKNGGRRCFS